MEEVETKEIRLDNIGRIISLDKELEEMSIMLVDSSPIFTKWLSWIEENLDFYRKDYSKASANEYILFIKDMVWCLIEIDLNKEPFNELDKSYYKNFDLFDFINKVNFLNLKIVSYRNYKGNYE